MNTLPTVKIQGKEYVQVKDRVLYFNTTYPNGAIVTEKIADEGEYLEIKATVTPDVSVPERKFTGHSQATWGDSMINKSSALENAETSAVGRALGMMGIGVIESVASADEVNKARTQPPKSAPKPIPQERPTAIKEAQEGMGLTPKYVTFVDEDGQTSQVDVLDLPEFDETELRWQLERLLDRAQDAKIIDLAKATESKATLKTAKKVSIIAGIRKYAALLEQNLEKATPKEPSKGSPDSPNLKALMHDGAIRNSD